MLFRAAIAAGLCLALMPWAGARGATFATFDADQFDANGFAYDDFSDFFAIDTSGGVISLDIMNDNDMANGLFGGMGSDITADFDANTTNLEVSLTVHPDNVATNLRVVLVDNDGPTSGEEYQFFVDLTGATPGVPIVLTQSLVSPGPVFSQPAFGQDPGDGVQNYGLRQVQIQSEFGSSDRLKVDIDYVKLIDPDDPLLVELTPSSFNAQTQNFTFGTYADPGVVTETADSFVINADPNTASGPTGGLGFNGLNIDFEAAEYMIEVEAKLLPGNTAGGFNVLLGDEDGDDSAPMQGSEDFLFTVDTSNFNTSEFTTVQIPLGDGTESLIETTFGFTNGGDGLQNYGLSQLQFQSIGEDDLGVLGIEFRRVSIVEMTEDPLLPGDADGDGDVDGDDLIAVQTNFGSVTPPPGDADGDGDVDGDDLIAVQTNFGATSAPASAVPEPSALLLALLGGALIGRRR